MTKSAEMTSEELQTTKEDKPVINNWKATGLDLRRKRCNRVATALSVLAGLLLLAALVSILNSLVGQGLAGITISNLIHSQGPPGPESGLGNAIEGSIIQTICALLMAAPVGIFCGIYLAAYGKDNKFASIVRFTADVLLSLPSILAGLFIYELWVVPTGHFSGFAGSMALAVISVPLIVRATEDMMSLVPPAMREAGYALGAPTWRVIWQIWVKAALGGILTGVLLALARMSGETAPLLFTSLGNQNWSANLNAPMANLPVLVYQYAGSSYEEWIHLAWTGALMITLSVLAVNLSAQFTIKRLSVRKRK